MNSADAMDIDADTQQLAQSASSAPLVGNQEPSDKLATIEALPRNEAIFLYGLDEMNTNDIKTYSDNLGLEKIEWINDSSCNLVFPTPEAALEAARALLANAEQVESMTTKDLLSAKPFLQASSQREFGNLFVRIATDEDVKERGARDRSRYYLLHGEENRDSAPKNTSINSRLGMRRERERRSSPYARRQEDGDVFSRLGDRRDDRASRRSRRRHGRSASPRSDRGQETRDEFGRHRRLKDRLSTHRRSASPANRESVQSQDEKVVELPEGLKARLGSKNGQDT